MKHTYSNRVLVCAYNTLFFNDIAHSVAVELVEFIKKTPHYRHQVKQATNTLQREIRRYTKTIGRITNEEVSLNDACDNMAEIIRTDVPKLEYTIKFALDKAKVSNSLLLAKIEAARCLAWGACINLDMRVKDIRKELPVNLDDMRLTAIAHAIERISSSFTYGVDFNKNENCLLAFRIIQKKLLNGKNIAESVNNAILS